MRLFTCHSCGQLVYFHNSACTRCGAALGFLPERLDMLALAPQGNGRFRPLGMADAPPVRVCANGVSHNVCNWLVAADGGAAHCLSCALNRTIPDLSVPGNVDLWQALEVEKRRLVYALLRLGLPVAAKGEDPRGLAFDFLADTPPSFSDGGRVLTGHADGVITLNIAEADSALRERMRETMDEPYRTLLGHFRHEVGHHYWDRLIAGTDRLPAFRSLFGDETRTYDAALQAHYVNGPAPDWHDRHVTAYASAHPWEDWAETWAHYLHIADTLETAWQYGMQIAPRAADDPALSARHDFDPFDEPDFDRLIAHWGPLSAALNCLNRSMGHGDAYPFVLPATVVEKLAFVHDTVRAARGVGQAG